MKQFFKKTAANSFFQIIRDIEVELDGKIYKTRGRDNDSVITLENWEQHKETFFTQRMETYKDRLNLAMKIKCELLELEKLPIDKTDYQVLKDCYKAYLEEKQALVSQ